MAFDQNKYKKDFAKGHYDTVLFSVPKGKKAVLKAEATARGVSLSRLIILALEKYCWIDLSKETN